MALLAQLRFRGRLEAVNVLVQCDREHAQTYLNQVVEMV
jgi:hypothetical protein